MFGFLVTIDALKNQSKVEKSEEVMPSDSDASSKMRDMEYALRDLKDKQHLKQQEYLFHILI